MFGRKMEDMWMSRITQECSPLYTTAQRLGDKGEIAPRGDEAAHVQAPVRVEIVDHPIITRHVWELANDVGEMGGEIRTGARAPAMPHQLPRRHDEDAIKARTPRRMYSGSRFSGWPGCAGCVGYLRCRICMPVFSSVQMTKRPWS